jgi:hypothetical protein
MKLSSLIIVVTQFPKTFINVTMSIIVLQLQYVSINNIHHAVRLYSLFGIDRNARYLRLLMEGQWLGRLLNMEIIRLYEFSITIVSVNLDASFLKKTSGN